MANVRDRMKKEITPTESTVLDIAGKAEPKKTKYPVNVVFDGDMEAAIRQRAKERGLGVATYIKTLVVQDLSQG